jgi:D-alanine-D-alanine ligase
MSAEKRQRTEEKPVVLHLCGSAASDYYEGVSTMYAKQCMEEALKHQTYKNVVCRVHLDGTWSFPTDMSEESLEKAERMTVAQAIQKITEMKPAAGVPHMFCLPGMTTYRSFFDFLNIPLVGNNAGVMALSTNKWQTKAVVAAKGVKVPEAEIIYKGQMPKMGPPFMVKPCNEDNSQGISLVKEGMDVQKALDEAFQFDHEILVERYVPLGRELRVAVLEKQDGSLELLPCIEYFLSEADPIRTAQHKLATDSRGVPVGFSATGGRKCPADVDDTLREKLRDMVVKSHNALGCRDYSIWDVRVDPAGEPYIIEACLYCSFALKSVVVLMAGAAGIEQKRVYEMLVDRAIKRKQAAGSEKFLGMRAR